MSAYHGKRGVGRRKTGSPLWGARMEKKGTKKTKNNV